MAEIKFQVPGQTNGNASVDTFSGSGLAFYGTSAGSSVQIAPARPYSVLLARSITSASDENFISGITGPNCSSATIRASSGGLSKIEIGT